MRTIGATPRQVRALIVYEAGVVALLAASAGAAVASIGGPALFPALQRGGLITAASSMPAGRHRWTAAGAVVLVGTVAAAIASRRAAAARPRVPAAGGRRARPLRWWRILVGLLCRGRPGLGRRHRHRHREDPTPTPRCRRPDRPRSWSASGWPRWRRGSCGCPTPLRARCWPAGSGHLAAANTTRRAHLLAGMLAPVIVLVSTAVGTLLMIGIDDRTLTGRPRPRGRTITMINSVVIGMICLFAAIMVVNAVAAVAAPPPRAGPARGSGATAGQLQRLVLEAAVVAGAGILLERWGRRRRPCRTRSFATKASCPTVSCGCRRSSRSSRGC